LQIKKTKLESIKI